MNTITIPASTIVPCDDRCMFAKHEDCDCTCQGVNHQRGAMLTALQREIPRTRVGRRIPVLTPGTPEWAFAETLLEQRDEGVTQRDLAAIYGVSAPTIRRTIKSLLFTLALAEKQEEEAAQAA